MVVAESFADIFHGNAVRNRLLTVTLPGELFDMAGANRHQSLTVDLREQVLVTGIGASYPFPIAASRHEQIMLGLDEIGGTLAHADTIRQFEHHRLLAERWV